MQDHTGIVIQYNRPPAYLPAGGCHSGKHHLQLSVQWFKNLGTMINDDKGKTGAEWWSHVKGKNYQGIKFSLAILF